MTCFEEITADRPSEAVGEDVFQREVFNFLQLFARDTQSHRGGRYVVDYWRIRVICHDKGFPNPTAVVAVRAFVAEIFTRGVSMPNR